MKKLVLLSFALFAIISISQAQISAGVNILSSETFVTVGTDPDAKLFGEGRLGTGKNITLELMGGYNVVQKNDANFYLGLGLGLEGNRKHDHDNDFYLAVPFGLLVKPFSSKNLALVLEAAPIFANDHGNYFRGGFGFKYTFR